MIYKKHDILPQYLPGSDFHINDNGLLSSRVPKPCHVDFYRTTNRFTGEELPNSETRGEAKRFIDKIVEIERSGMI